MENNELACIHQKAINWHIANLVVLFFITFKGTFCYVDLIVFL